MERIEKEAQCCLEPENISIFTRHPFPFTKDDWESIQFEGEVEYGMEIIIRRTWPIED